MAPGSNNTCYKLVVGEFMPFILLSGPPEKPNVAGTMVEILDIIFHKLGGCYEYIGRRGLLAGTRLENGSWSGLGGLLERKEVDMTALGLVINLERYQDFEVSEYLYLDAASAGYVRPRVEAYVDGFLRPFTLMMWILILLTSLAVLAVMCFITRSYENLTQQERSNGIGGRRKKFKTVVQESLDWIVNCLLSQSVSCTPRGDSVRIVSALWLLISFILGSVYRSNLKAMLILPKVSLPFDSLEELVETDLPVWVQKLSALHVSIMSSPKTTAIGKLSNHILPVEQMDISIPKAVQKLMAGEHVLAGPRSAIVQIMHMGFTKTGRCVTYMMSESFLTGNMLSFLFPRGSPLKAQVDPIIRRLRESGILEHAYKKGVSNATECLKPFGTTAGEDIRALSLEDFYGVFLVYIGGITLSLLAFLVEISLGFGSCGQKKTKRDKGMKALNGIYKYE